MWFIFPQLLGLGHSAMAQRYALHSMAEAQTYLAHAILGSRLREATGLVNAVQRRTAHDIFDTPDDLKFHSCVTLFARAQPDNGVFNHALVKFFNSRPDRQTFAKLAESAK